MSFRYFTNYYISYKYKRQNYTIMYTCVCSYTYIQMRRKETVQICVIDRCGSTGAGISNYNSISNLLPKRPPPLVNERVPTSLNTSLSTGIEHDQCYEIRNADLVIFFSSLWCNDILKLEYKSRRICYIRIIKKITIFLIEKKLLEDDLFDLDSITEKGGLLNDFFTQSLPMQGNIGDTTEMLKPKQSSLVTM